MKQQERKRQEDQQSQFRQFELLMCERKKQKRNEKKSKNRQNIRQFVRNSLTQQDPILFFKKYFLFSSGNFLV